MAGTLSTYLDNNVNSAYALCNIMDFGPSLTPKDEDIRDFFVEGTFTFINRHWEGMETTNAYYKYTVDVHVDKHYGNISLFSSNRYGLKPVILQYINPSDETDIHYYLSLLFTRNGWNWNRIYFNGISSHKFSTSYIKYSGSTLPDGYTIYKEPLPMRKLNLVSGYIGNDSASYSYEQIKALEDRITALENK